MATDTTILWFRQDLRLDDNPALIEAKRRGGSIVPVFIWAPEEEDEWPAGGASRWWLHHSLVALDGSLRRHGLRLIIRSGPSEEAILKLVAETGATGVLWNRRYEPASIARDISVKERLRRDGLDADSMNAALLYEPWTVRTKSNTPFKVFTPFWKACGISGDPREPESAPSLKGRAPQAWPASTTVDDLRLLPTIPWDAGLDASWTPGELGAVSLLARFVAEAIADYAEGRDRPGEPLTSRLSPHLHWGEISPRRIWHTVHAALAGGGKSERRSAEKYLAEIGWREFAHHLIFHFPETATEPLRPEFAQFPWRDDDAALRAWQRGRTGYPLVDAGMRELWHTGWMHNRVRMVAASFLVKHLLLPWQAGAAWFWDTLVDADLASNTLGWQWTAGCGADAAPYFRIFNPVTQGERFDAEAAYVRRWVPEIASLPNSVIHNPWEATTRQLDDAGVVLGETYPRPIVDHKEARRRALAALASLSDDSRTKVAAMGDEQ